MSPEQRLKKLESLLSIVDESLTREEFVKAFENVIGYIKAAENRMSDKVDVLGSDLTLLHAQLAADTTSDVSDLKAQAQALLSSIQEDTKTTLDAQVRKLDRKLAELRQPEDGHTPTTEELVSIIQPLIPEPIQGEPGTPAPLEELLALKAQIADLEKRLTQTKPSGVFIGPSRGVFLYTEGTKRGLQNTLNLIAGTGMTISYNRASGRNDITLNSTASGGSLSVLAATGLVNDSNVNFTFASTPALVIVNGAAYRDGHGCTISGTNVTLDNAPGVGGDIYALG